MTLQEERSGSMTSLLSKLTSPAFSESYSNLFSFHTHSSLRFTHHKAKSKEYHGSAIQGTFHSSTHTSLRTSSG